MTRANKGEWSEFYAFLKLLAEGEIYGADENLNKLSEWRYPLVNILRQSEAGHRLEFHVDAAAGVVKITAANAAPIEISQSSCRSKAELLLAAIRRSSGSFSVPTIEDLRAEMQRPKVKEDSTSKRDITVTLKDAVADIEHEVGFSIKSYLGGASTLFNASQQTNFIYRVSGLSQEDFENVNSLEAPRKRLAKIRELGAHTSFEGVQGDQLSANLKIIDSRMDEIMAHMLRYYYEERGKDMSDLAQLLEEDDPCGFGSGSDQKFYVYKIKNFLTSCALGMTPKAVWNGVYDASGGYLIVKEDGELVCYHIYNWNAFQEYLFSRTYLDTPSTSRHDFGSLYKDGVVFRIKLNLQIRFG